MSHNQILDKIKKRDGSLVDFNKNKIKNAINKAAREVLENDEKACQVAKNITQKVQKKIAEKYSKTDTPSVEDIQDLVEHSLMQESLPRIARAYISYRDEHQKLRESKAILGVKDDLKLPVNTLAVLKKRYLLKDKGGKIRETPDQLFRRVAHHVAAAEKKFDSIHEKEAEETFYHMMRNMEFMPNSPTLMNAGTAFGQLSACFVLPVEDSIDGIFTTLKNMAKIHQTGGGTGFDFSQLRAKGDLVSTTKGKASGPLSFMSIFNQATSVIVQGGRRRGANMGILRCDHPDIMEFAQVKTQKGVLDNFNISVGATDEFMDAVIKNKKFELLNPRTGKKVKEIKAIDLFNRIIDSAWHTGDPGLIYLDEINRQHPLETGEKIQATNPCGEQPLLSYESCNLASINLTKMIDDHSINWEKLKNTVYAGIRFLDNVIEVNKFPLQRIKKITLANRKIGLGVMGFADMLIQLGIPYNSEQAINMAEKLMKFIRYHSVSASEKLAEERGVFPNYEKSIYKKKGLKMRNSTVNTIAPTGTISIIANCSSGIEPLFAISYVRNVLSGSRLYETNPLFEKIAKERGFYNEELLSKIAKQASLQSIEEIPDDIKKVFVTAFDVSPEQHLKIQAAFQKHTDNSVSKTINLPSDCTLDEIKDIYIKSYKLKCKGITIYRYGSKENQVLTFKRDEKDTDDDPDNVTVDSEYSGGCAGGACSF